MIFIGFAEIPTSEMIELDGVEQAVCRCRHRSPDAIIGWRVNGSSLGQFPDITTGSINENGSLVYTLTIPARSDYSGMVVVCLALFTDGSPTESTPPATVIFTTGLSKYTKTMIIEINKYSIHLASSEFHWGGGGGGGLASLPP